jgi:hypothetical protein
MRGLSWAAEPRLPQALNNTGAIKTIIAASDALERVGKGLKRFMSKADLILQTGLG